MIFDNFKDSILSKGLLLQAFFSIGLGQLPLNSNSETKSPIYSSISNLEEVPSEIIEYISSYDDTSKGQVVNDKPLYFVQGTNGHPVGLIQRSEHLTTNPVTEKQYPFQLSTLGYPYQNVFPQVAINGLDGNAVPSRTAVRGEFPYIVQILLNGGHSCGGIIWNKNHIITAAHCFFEDDRSYERLKLSELSVVAGVYNRSKKEKTQMKVNITRVIIPHQYDNKAAENGYDIAVVSLTQSLKIVECQIEAARFGWRGNSRRAKVAGWGVFNSSGEAPDILQAGEIDLDASCPEKEIQGKYNLDQRSVICGIGRLETGELLDVCGGDSGGPLVCINEHGENYVCGLVSHGPKCGSRKKANSSELNQSPGVYTAIESYQKFIDWAVSVDRRGDSKNAFIPAEERNIKNCTKYFESVGDIGECVP